MTGSRVVMKPAFPCVEVLEVSSTPGLTRGQFVPLQSGLVMGRAFRIEWRDDRWWLFDLGGQSRTWHNGAPVYDAELKHADIIDAPNGLCLVVWLVDPVGERNEAIEAQVLDDIDDDARWQVWADWLLERGQQLGQVMLGAPLDTATRARSLGAWSRRWSDGFLDLDWWKGFPRRAVLRAPTAVARAADRPAVLLAQLLEAPTFRFLRHLEVDVASFADPLRLTGDLTAVLDVLQQAPPHRWLETIRLGPLADAPVLVAKRWGSIIQRHTRVTTTAERAVQVATAGSIEVVRVPTGVRTTPGLGETVGLADRERHLIGEGEDLLVNVEAGPHTLSGLQLMLETENARWRLLPLSHHRLVLNERDSVGTILRDADLFDVEGLTLRFRMR